MASRSCFATFLPPMVTVVQVSTGPGPWMLTRTCSHFPRTSCAPRIRAARIRGAHDVIGKWEQVLVNIQGPGPVLTWTTVTIGGKKVAKQLRDAMDPAVTSGTGRYFY